MPPPRRKRSFLGSKSGQGLIAFLAFSLVVSVAVAWGFLSASMGRYATQKSAASAAEARLTEAFVAAYAALANQIPMAPAADSFRAQAIARRDGAAAAGPEQQIMAPGPPQQILAQTVALGASLFLVLAGAGLTAALIHERQANEREAAQEALRESEARLRDYAATASDWFWEQGEDLRFTYTSTGAPTGEDKIIGTTRRELFAAGRNFGLSLAQLDAHDADLEARRPFQNLRFQSIDPNGRIRYVSVSGRPVFDIEGRFRGYRGTGRDVTSEVAAEIELSLRVEERTAELRTAQAELLRREKLSTLGQLTATVAHELRNPLSAIRNTVFAIKETTAGAGLNLERPLTRVERNVTRCDRIIADLLDFTRMRELNCAPADFDTWVDEVLSNQRLPEGMTLRRLFGARGLIVNFDAERMRRVIVNLVENAAQAMTDLEGRERTLSVTTRLADGALEILVADTGAGIAPDVLGKVFEPLFSTKSFGTGLGLPTVKQIVEQHGGTVAIQSEVGRGTEVAVRLPVSVDSKEMAA